MHPASKDVVIVVNFTVQSFEGIFSLTSHVRRYLAPYVYGHGKLSAKIHLCQPHSASVNPIRQNRVIFMNSRGKLGEETQPYGSSSGGPNC
jgi:hypothetical protein